MKRARRKMNTPNKQTTALLVIFFNPPLCISMYRKMVGFMTIIQEKFLGGI
jgi:hypothetical protein